MRCGRNPSNLIKSLSRWQIGRQTGRGRPRVLTHRVQGKAGFNRRKGGLSGVAQQSDLAPSLEALRQSSAPAWLWDGPRARIVWANAAGIAAFDCGSLFDLIDRPFDDQEEGVARIAALSRVMGRGGKERALLHFPSSTHVTPFDTQVYVHALADGRPGLLVVTVPPTAPVPPPFEEKNAIAEDLLSTLPLAHIVMKRDGTILHCNKIAVEIFGSESLSIFSDMLSNVERANVLLTRFASRPLDKTVELLQTPDGQREFRILTHRIGSDGESRFNVLLEDVTERRALERRLEAGIGVPFDMPSSTARTDGIDSISTGHPSTSVEAAFEAISQSLKANLQQSLPAAEIVAARAAPILAVEPTPMVAVAVPLPVRLMLDQAASALLVQRQGKLLYANGKALPLLGHESLAAVLADNSLLAKLAHVPMGGMSVVRLNPGAAELQVTRQPLPWHNGPAEQFSLKALPQTKSVEASPVAATARPEVAMVDKATTVDSAQVIAPQVHQEAPEITQPTPIAVEPEVSHAIDEVEVRAMLDVVSDGFITLDAQGQILGFSAGAEAIFGCNATEAVAKPFAAFLTADSRKAMRDYLAGLHGPGLAAVFNDGREMLAMTAQGGQIPLFVTAGRLQSPQWRTHFS